jgi:hypothetical protein
MTRIIQPLFLNIILLVITSNLPCFNLILLIFIIINFQLRVLTTDLIKSIAT